MEFTKDRMALLLLLPTVVSRMCSAMSQHCPQREQLVRLWAIWALADPLTHPFDSGAAICTSRAVHEGIWVFPVWRGWLGGDGTGTGPCGVAATSLFPSAPCKHRQKFLVHLFPVKSTDLRTSGCFLSLRCVLLKLLFRFLGFPLKITSMSSSNILKIKMVPHLRTEVEIVSAFSPNEK